MKDQQERQPTRLPYCGDSWGVPLTWVRGWKCVHFPTPESREEAPKKLGVLASFPIFGDKRDPKHSQLEYFLKALKIIELPITTRRSTT